jgi:predicted N-acetyltransferase YhbS
MPDMLVRLYALPPLEPLLEHQRAQNITVRRALPPEMHVVLAWVREAFEENWVSECAAAFARSPSAVFIAIYAGQPVGFAAYDATAKGMFGPTGVSPSMRGKGTGKALLVMTLHDMHAQGYAYGVIGGVGPAAFYTKAVGAVMIADSTPGIYGGLLT